MKPRNAAPPPQSPRALAIAAGAHMGAMLAGVSAILALEYFVAGLRVLAAATPPPGAAVDPTLAKVLRAAKEGVAAVERALNLGLVTPQPGDPGGGLVG